LQSETEALLGRLKASTDRCRELKKQADSANASAELVREELRAANRELATIRADAQGMAGVIAGLERQVARGDSLEARAKGAEEESAQKVQAALLEKEAALARETAAKKELQRMQERRRGELAEAQAAHDTLLAETRARLQAQLQARDQELSSLREQLSSAALSVERSQREARAATTDLSRVVDAGKEQVNALQRTSETLAARLKAAEEERDAAQRASRDALARAAAAVEEGSREKMSLAERANAAESSLATSSQRLSQAEAELKGLKASHEELTRQLANLQRLAGESDNRLLRQASETNRRIAAFESVCTILEARLLDATLSLARVGGGGYPMPSPLPPWQVMVGEELQNINSLQQQQNGVGGGQLLLTDGDASGLGPSAVNTSGLRAGIPPRPSAATAAVPTPAFVSSSSSSRPPSAIRSVGSAILPPQPPPYVPFSPSSSSSARYGQLPQQQHQSPQVQMALLQHAHQEELSSLQQHAQDLTAALHEMQGEISQLQAHAAMLENENASLRAALETAEESLAMAHEQLHSYSARESSRIAEMGEVKAQLEMKKLSEERASNRASALANQLQEAETTISELKRKLLSSEFGNGTGPSSSNTGGLAAAAQQLMQALVSSSSSPGRSKKSSSKGATSKHSSSSSSSNKLLKSSVLQSLGPSALANVALSDDSAYRASDETADGNEDGDNGNQAAVSALLSQSIDDLLPPRVRNALEGGRERASHHYSGKNRSVAAGTASASKLKGVLKHTQQPQQQYQQGEESERKDSREDEQRQHRGYYNRNEDSSLAYSRTTVGSGNSPAHVMNTPATTAGVGVAGSAGGNLLTHGIDRTPFTAMGVDDTTTRARMTIQGVVEGEGDAANSPGGAAGLSSLQSPLGVTAELEAIDKRLARLGLAQQAQQGQHQAQQQVQLPQGSPIPSPSPVSGAGYQTSSSSAGDTARDDDGDADADEKARRRERGMPSALSVNTLSSVVSTDRKSAHDSTGRSSATSRTPLGGHAGEGLTADEQAQLEAKLARAKQKQQEKQQAQQSQSDVVSPSASPVDEQAGVISARPFDEAAATMPAPRPMVRITESQVSPGTFTGETSTAGGSGDASRNASPVKESQHTASSLQASPETAAQHRQQQEQEESAAIAPVPVALIAVASDGDEAVLDSASASPLRGASADTEGVVAAVSPTKADGGDEVAPASPDPLSQSAQLRADDRLAALVGDAEDSYLPESPYQPQQRVDSQPTQQQQQQPPASSPFESSGAYADENFEEQEEEVVAEEEVQEKSSEKGEQDEAPEIQEEAVEEKGAQQSSAAVDQEEERALEEAPPSASLNVLEVSATKPAEPSPSKEQPVPPAVEEVGEESHDKASSVSEDSFVSDDHEDQDEKKPLEQLASPEKAEGPAPVSPAEQPLEASTSAAEEEEEEEVPEQSQEQSAGSTSTAKVMEAAMQRLDVAASSASASTAEAERLAEALRAAQGEDESGERAVAAVPPRTPSSSLKAAYAADFGSVEEALRVVPDDENLELSLNDDDEDEEEVGEEGHSGEKDGEGDGAYEEEGFESEANSPARQAVAAPAPPTAVSTHHHHASQRPQHHHQPHAHSSHQEAEDAEDEEDNIPEDEGEGDEDSAVDKAVEAAEAAAASAAHHDSGDIYEDDHEAASPAKAAPAPTSSAVVAAAAVISQSSPGAVGAGAAEDDEYYDQGFELEESASASPSRFQQQQPQPQAKPAAQAASTAPSASAAAAAAAEEEEEGAVEEDIPEEVPEDEEDDGYDDADYF
jgi:hypothetical protein